MDIGGLNIINVTDYKELPKIVSWYNTSIRSKIDIPGNSVDYNDIKDELYSL